MDFKEEYIEHTSKNSHDYVRERNKPMPSLNHGQVQANLVGIFYSKFRKKYKPISELSLDLSDWVSVPDVSIYPFRKYNAANDVVKVKEPPLTVMEILSPKQTQSELIQKARQYFDKGVKSVWIVFPELENVYVFTSHTDYEMYRKGQMLKDPQLDVEIQVDDVFE